MASGPDAMTGSDDAARFERGAASGATWRGTWGPAVLLVVAASAVVALAATGVRLLLPSADLPGAWGPVMRLAGAAGAAAGLAGLLAQRRRLAQKGRRAPDPTAAGLVAAATTMALLTLLALASPTGHLTRIEAAAPDTPDTPDAAQPATPRAPSSGVNKVPPMNGFGLGLIRGRRAYGGPTITLPASPQETPQQSLLRRASRLVLLALILVVVFLAIRSFRRRGRGVDEDEDEPAEPEPPVAAEDAAAGLEASLDELAAPGRDPRQQITAAYRRLLAALATAGAPREPQEAPYEHLDRALGPLRLEPGPMHQLAELYVVAQFSEHPVTETHRAAAAAALEASLAGLRPTTVDRGPSIRSRGTHERA